MGSKSVKWWIGGERIDRVGERGGPADVVKSRATELICRLFAVPRSRGDGRIQLVVAVWDHELNSPSASGAALSILAEALAYEFSPCDIPIFSLFRVQDEPVQGCLGRRASSGRIFIGTGNQAGVWLIDRGWLRPVQRGSAKRYRTIYGLADFGGWLVSN
jgi:hypothetical protein